MAKVIVIGGGPAGMMAAIKASEKHQVTLVEGNEKLGKKLFITGKGRCNVTNAKDISDFFDYVPTNPQFLYSSLYTFTNDDTMNFFENLGVKLKIERGDRVFPNSNKSSDIISAMENSLAEKKVEIILKNKVERIHTINKYIQYIELEDGNRIKGDYFILCTGGASYPQTGSTGVGFKFAKDLGHNIKDIKPSLVPIELKEKWVKELQGLSLKNVELSIVNENKKIVYKKLGEMIFTHFGISGPIVLSSSSFLNYGKFKAIINLKPGLTEEQLDTRIQRDFSKYCNKDFKNSLNDLLPKKIIDRIIELSNIDPDKKVNSITKQERKYLGYILQNLTLNIKGKRPISEAIVTSGGIDVLEIDPSTMKSKVIDNLYFAGEVIDVDGFTGGFNIQIALSTGYLAGMSIK